MWSSIFLLGAIRPTNRKFTSPSSRISSSTGCRGAFVSRSVFDGDRQHAGVGESQLFELLAVVLGVAERKIGRRRQSCELFARDRRQPEQRRRVGREESRRRHVVILQDAPVRQRGECCGHRRRQREMKDRDVAALRRRIGERPDVVAQIVVDRQRENVRLVAHRAEEVAHAAGAVADGVALVGGRHPLVHAHQRFSSTRPAFDSGLSGRPRKMAGRYCCSSNSSSASRT